MQTTNANAGPGIVIDTVIVRAAIHPAIGIARVGDSADEFYVGPQVTDPPSAPQGFYRDSTGALKRQAAEFRIYGYNAAGEVVGELTADNATISWTVHVANRKPQWYQFQEALDIPEAAGQAMPRRNPSVKPENRDILAIDPGPRSIAGVSTSGPAYVFDSGKFEGTPVCLGELRTDAAGRLLFLGGRGISASPAGTPIFTPSDPNSFNNADGWYDDTSDGPVTAEVAIDGRSIPVAHGWVVTAPPNYGTQVIGWRTMYDLLVDTYVANGWMPMPATASFSRDILPYLERLSNLQWVNKGFAALFGSDGPMNFADPAFVARLAHAPKPEERGTRADLWAELRRAIFHSFRPFGTPVNEPRLWPQIYGDGFSGGLDGTEANIMLALPSVQQVMLERWVAGDFINDWNPALRPPAAIEDVPLAGQPAMLDKAALHYCLADAFHPGCEMTWPLRHPSMFQAPFRFRYDPALPPRTDYGKTLTPAVALAAGGPLYHQYPGSITRWSALPWQADTAFCRSGYDPDYDPYLPTFWPARVPNQVLTEEDYRIVMDTEKPREVRLAAFNNRESWDRALPADTVAAMMYMVAHFNRMGVVEARPGFNDDPDFPPVIFVESVPASQITALRAQAATLASAGPRTALQKAGWKDEAHLAAFRALRFQRR